MTYSDIKLSDYLQILSALKSEDSIVMYTSFAQVFLQLDEAEALEMNINELHSKLEPYLNICLQPLEVSRTLKTKIVIEGRTFTLLQNLGNLQFGRFIAIQHILTNANEPDILKLTPALLKILLIPEGMTFAQSVENKEVQTILANINVQDAYDVISFFLFGSQVFTSDTLLYLKHKLKQIIPRNRNSKKTMGGTRSYFH